MSEINKRFGCMVFNDAVMAQRLPKPIYKALRKTISAGTHLELDVANVVANAMKDWAVERGVTHYTHWFQPMTGVTAEKHDSFITPDGNGSVIMEFSGKELVKGEPDASSLPSGGLRATFEARGYTAWDPTSYAFIKNNTLYIPTVFCSYGGEALDKKTPLLRSMEALDKQALRVLRLFGNQSVSRVITTVGAEQEYFLIDRALYEKRRDLINCGRTLFGARPPKGQELEDHYFGAIPARVKAFMRDLDEELWQLGVMAKTEHNETAPAQHELAPVFATTNIAADHNQLMMELMKSVAQKHDLACLLHEKPFAGMNGSGKHNNWSLTTDTGLNLLEPGETPFENAQFLLFLCAVIEAVDEYQPLLRISVASAGNDHRLGAHEAPPAIISMFLGDELSEILNAVEAGTMYIGKEQLQMEIGATVLPHFPKDTTDRNRTSPFAFTGNKFEFRSLGSTQSISGPNTTLNTIVAEILSRYADRLEQADDFKHALKTLIRETISQHKRIIFNGNNYSDEWVEEAERRGLYNLRTTPEALQEYLTPQHIALFEKHGVYTETELRARCAVRLSKYTKTIHIEALTMLDMLNKEIIPAVISYENELAKLMANKKAIGIEFSTQLESDLLQSISRLGATLSIQRAALSDALEQVEQISDPLARASAYYTKVFSAMTALRDTADQLESLVDKRFWTLPSYDEMLYSIQ
ncbi:MAG: glutamine synthetase type III [Ruminococcus sp.]|nr:glutamine synthetase type III [Ruminococcus sp.]